MSTAFHARQGGDVANVHANELQLALQRGLIQTK